MEYIEVHVFQKYGLYKRPCLRLNPLLLVCHKKQNKKAKVGTKSNWCSKLYQSYGLNLPLHGAEGVAPLFLLTQKFTGSLLNRSDCLAHKTSSVLLSATVGRTASDCLPKIAAKKKRAKITLISFYLSFFISLIPSSTYSRISFACSKPIFPPSSSLAINFFITSGTVGFFK